MGVVAGEGIYGDGVVNFAWDGNDYVTRVCFEHIFSEAIVISILYLKLIAWRMFNC